MAAVIQFENICKHYPSSRGPVRHVLSDLNFVAGRGEFIFLVGPCGSGKSTVMRLALGLENPSAGAIRIGSTDLSTLKRSALPILRRSIGYVAQDTRLLPDRNVLANVALPAHAAGLSKRECQSRAQVALERAGLSDPHIGKLSPLELSGGQSRRVALARALVNRPAVLLVDELTAYLDQSSAQKLLRLMSQFAAAGVTILAATHDEALASASGARCIALRPPGSPPTP
ncbi:MAG TPA: ATP-binding cassette domain-containing protein [Burkholderiaceae bacterium]|nr:ATP-binding cassette domain-containing protein [Burkholderiaceae bacterium]